MRFDHGSAVAGVAWSDMVADVLARTTERPAPTPRHGPPRRLTPSP
ncbi:hypothetical protein [Virgisporangium aurantiacum]|nr:hypothetical protein [Virgisporangium aurantiacum]